MPALLDVIFSMIIGFTIILIIVNANAVVAEGTFSYQGETLVQQMLLSTATLVEGDFRNIGFNVEKDQLTNSGIILYADSDRIIYRTDLPQSDGTFDGIPDVIEYYTGEAGEPGFQNENVKLLYRKVNDDDPHGVGYVTDFTIRYYKSNREEITDLPLTDPIGNVHLIELELEVQTPFGLLRDPSTVQEGTPDALYSTTLWRQTRLSSRNLFKR